MNEGRPRILYVDDDLRQLTAFKAAFRRTHLVLIAQSPLEGRRILNDQQIDIIITDQRMPEMSGIDFLESIIPDYPDLIKILVTGYAEINDVINAINKGQIYCYLDKPWDEQELRIILKNAYDISTTRRELKDKIELLQKTNGELEKFVYSASHDLRAPLLSIKGVINYAKSTMPDTGLQYLSMIEQSIDKLDVFVGNIINYYQNVKCDAQHEALDFEKMLKETWSGFDFLENQSRIRFNVQVRQDQEFKSDEFRMQVIFNNLLLNAIKYQRKEEIHQEVSVAVDVGVDQATIHIDDNGIGIDPEHIGKIFQMFYRATHEKPGSGLGLYIAKEAVSKIGGEIEVRSVPAKGTSFKIVIPNKH
jgi:two-component system sensor histidine kinase/response regulator